MKFLYAVRGILFLFYSSLLCIMIISINDPQPPTIEVHQLEDYIFILPLFSISVLSFGFFKVWNSLSIGIVSILAIAALGLLAEVGTEARVMLVWILILSFAALFEALVFQTINIPNSAFMIKAESTDHASR